MEKQTIYQRHGYENRDAYLADLAEEYGLPLDEVREVADLYGPSEDFDGLISHCQDFAY